MTSHDSTVILVADWTRVVLVVLCSLLIAVTLRLAEVRWRKGAPFASGLAPVAMTLLAVSVMGTSWERRHHEVTWHLPVNAVGIILALWAVVVLLRLERSRVGPLS
jgi:hypothetical protein